MNEPPKTYRIETLADIFKLPTIEQMKTCLAEITDSMILARSTVDLMNATAGHEAISLEGAFPEYTEWIDDGKGEVGALFFDADGNDLLSVGARLNTELTHPEPKP
jgi:hypothetical protein